MYKDSSDEKPGLFVWRGCEHEHNDDENVVHIQRNDQAFDQPLQITNETSDRNCKYCEETLRKHDRKAKSEAFYPGWGYVCLSCGWVWECYFDRMQHGQYYDSYSNEAIMLWFDLNDEEVLLEELGCLFQRDFSKIYEISPRRFEELIADVYNRHGFKPTLTKASRDGGYDVMLFDKKGKQSLVEVKRYYGKVGVQIVRQLRGVQLTQGVRTAKLVTSGYFTKPAIEEAYAEMPKNMGFELELVDADELFQLLGIYRNPNASVFTHFDGG